MFKPRSCHTPQINANDVSAPSCCRKITYDHTKNSAPINSSINNQTYTLDETLGTDGNDRTSMFNDAMTFDLVELHLAGGGGFTLVDERPKVFERHLWFLPAEIHTRSKFTLHSTDMLKSSTRHVNLHGNN